MHHTGWIEFVSAGVDWELLAGAVGWGKGNEPVRTYPQGLDSPGMLAGFRLIELLDLQVVFMLSY
jgi:hypothetical protein